MGVSVEATSPPTSGDASPASTGRAVSPAGGMTDCVCSDCGCASLALVSFCFPFLSLLKILNPFSNSFSAAELASAMEFFFAPTIPHFDTPLFLRTNFVPSGSTTIVPGATSSAFSGGNISHSISCCFASAAVRMSPLVMRGEVSCGCAGAADESSSIIRIALSLKSSIQSLPSRMELASLLIASAPRLNLRETSASLNPSTNA